mgnify:CR=1 FL=1
MTQTWVTTASPNVEAMVNSLTAACDSGFVPEAIHVLSLSDIEADVEEAITYAERIVTAYGGDELTVHRTPIDDETEFGTIRDHVQSAIEGTEEADEIAVDITPGRKFMSAIAFAAGMRYGADRVYYLYISSTDYFGRLYPEIPRTAIQLYDRTEGY